MMVAVTGTGLFGAFVGVIVIVQVYLPAANVAVLAETVNVWAVAGLFVVAPLCGDTEQVPPDGVVGDAVKVKGTPT